MYLIPEKEIYHFHDFKKEDFPISYDESEFPQGFEHIEVVHREDGEVGVYLFGNVDSSISVKLSDIEKVLEFIEEHKLLGKKVPFIMNSSIREAVKRAQENKLKP